MKKVLIIDLAGGELNPLQSILGDKMTQVFLATNETEALTFLAKNRVNSILLEPVIDNTEEKIQNPGLTLYNHIRKCHPRLKFLFYSIVSKRFLINAGFPKDIVHIQKPKYSGSILAEIHRE